MLVTIELLFGRRDDILTYNFEFSEVVDRDRPGEEILKRFT